MAPRQIKVRDFTSTGERWEFQTHAASFGSSLVFTVPCLICSVPCTSVGDGPIWPLGGQAPNTEFMVLQSWFVLECSSHLVLIAILPRPALISDRCSGAGEWSQMPCMPCPGLGKPGALPGLLSLDSSLFRCCTWFPCCSGWGPACGRPPGLPKLCPGKRVNHKSYQKLLRFPISVCFNVSVMPATPRVPLQRGQVMSWAFDLSSPYSTGIWKWRLSIFSSCLVEPSSPSLVAFTFPSPHTIMLGWQPGNTSHTSIIVSQIFSQWSVYQETVGAPFVLRIVVEVFCCNHCVGWKRSAGWSNTIYNLRFQH